MFLEVKLVNPVLAQLSLGEVGERFVPADAISCMRMYTDEGYHALAAMDLSVQVERASGVENRGRGLPVEVLRNGFCRLVDGLDSAADRRLAKILFVAVSEMLISGNLGSVAHSEGVVTAVRDTVGDHASDERRHHAFFSGYLEQFWDALSYGQRGRLGALVPDMVRVFFAPEVDDLGLELASYGLGDREVRDAVDEAYREELVLAAIRDAIAPLVAHFRRLGVLDVGQVRHAFGQHGMVS